MVINLYIPREREPTKNIITSQLLLLLLVPSSYNLDIPLLLFLPHPNLL